MNFNLHINCSENVQVRTLQTASHAVCARTGNQTTFPATNAPLLELNKQLAGHSWVY